MAAVAALLALSFSLAAAEPDAGRVRRARGQPPPAPAVHRPAELPELVRELGRGEPLVLHFWATWCDACRGEFQRLGPLLLALPGLGVRVALVSIDAPATRPRAPGMLAGLGLSALPAIFMDAPSPESVASALSEPGFDGVLPANFVFDREGRKLKAFLGTARAAALEAAAISAKRGPASPRD
jgi:thiol-disulfide isomerase/thioredoxin